MTYLLSVTDLLAVFVVEVEFVVLDVEFVVLDVVFDIVFDEVLLFAVVEAVGGVMPSG